MILKAGGGCFGIRLEAVDDMADSSSCCLRVQHGATWGSDAVVAVAAVEPGYSRVQSS